MTQLIWLESSNTAFPESRLAQTDPDGLLAAGYSLSASQVLRAYRQGIFPWFNTDQPVLWWTPSARMVLFCDNLKISTSLNKRLKQIAKNENSIHCAYQITTDICFAEVISSCSATRAHSGTWIGPEIINVYTQLHALGFAHSIETWYEGKLVGGLYGINIGHIFFGESMFALKTDCSKIAFTYLVNFLRKHQVKLIDCQQETVHLANFGATTIPRKKFESLLALHLNAPTPRWQAARLNASGEYIGTVNLQE